MATVVERGHDSLLRLSKKGGDGDVAFELRAPFSELVLLLQFLETRVGSDVVDGGSERHVLRSPHEAQRQVFVERGPEMWDQVGRPVHLPWISFHQGEIVHARGRSVEDATLMGMDSEVDVSMSGGAGVAPKGGDEGGPRLGEMEPSQSSGGGGEMDGTWMALREAGAEVQAGGGRVVAFG